MKYMLIMRVINDAAVEASKEIPFEEMINRMGAYNEEMINAGVLLAGEGLSDAAEGAVVDFSERRSDCHGRPIRRDPRTVQRVLDPSGGFEGRSCAVGAAMPAGAGDQAGDPPCHR